MSSWRRTSMPSSNRTRDQLPRWMPRWQHIEKVALSHLLTLHGKQRIGQSIDVNLVTWPSFLYIPNRRNALDYWIGPAPDDHRYGLERTLPAAATANRASRQDGTLFSFSQLLNEERIVLSLRVRGRGLLQALHNIGCHRPAAATRLHRNMSACSWSSFRNRQPAMSRSRPNCFSHLGSRFLVALICLVSSNSK